jgi:hypothetical protein
MNVFDAAKDKIEELSDKVLDKGSEAAGDATGGQYTEQINQARDAADERIGDGPAAEADPLPEADPESGTVPPLGG